MTTYADRHAFVMRPLLRAIEHLPEEITVDGTTLRRTGDAARIPLVGDFAAYRAFVHGPGFHGHIDLTAATSYQCAVTLSLSGAPPRLLSALFDELRAELAPPTTAPAPPDAIMGECRTA
jgi:hypothetical protein